MKFPQGVQVRMKGARIVKSGRGAWRVLSWTRPWRGVVPAGLAASVALLVAGSAAWAESEPVWVLPENGCTRLTFNEARFVVCHYDARRYRVRLWLDDDRGETFGSLRRLESWLQARGGRLLLAMNGGMFTPEYRPAGLYIEQGREIKSINLRRGRGNFHLMPNGVFWVRGSRAGVMESRRFARLYRRGRLKPDFATQSGPMLVIDGRLHPRFRSGSDSRKIRNGVGVRRARGRPGGHDVFFALSLDPVNFHTFARLFRDVLRTPDALFLDGSVSRLRTPELSIGGLFGGGIGPIIGVSEGKDAMEGAQSGKAGK